MANALVDKVKYILQSRIMESRGATDDLHQKLQELAAWVVTLEGDDWDDEDEECHDGHEESTLLQRGRGGVPLWRSSWSSISYSGRHPRSRT